MRFYCSMFLQPLKHFVSRVHEVVPQLLGQEGLSKTKGFHHFASFSFRK